MEPEPHTESDADSVELPIAGCRLQQVWFWGLVRLTFVRDDFEAWLDFSTGTFRESPLASAEEFDAERSPRIGHLCLDLWGHCVRRGAITGNGDLQLTFDNGAEFHVPPLDGAEAWNYCDRDDHHVIALPSGGISHWGPGLPGIDRVDGRHARGGETGPASSA
jgi:hypothetical protein